MNISGEMHTKCHSISPKSDARSKKESISLGDLLPKFLFLLGFIGLRSLREGNRQLARKAFARAIRIDPLRLKNYLRYLRTLLPTAMARSLTGRSAR